jgi:hypothetical protein
MPSRRWDVVQGVLDVGAERSGHLRAGPWLSLSRDRSSGLDDESRLLLWTEAVA